MNEQTDLSRVPAVATRKPPVDIRVVTDPIPVLDTARFEHMQRIAVVMAASNLIPESLSMTGDKEHRQLLPAAQITANCFLVVNQAVRWGLDPFAVSQCVSVVHGRLCYEGKLIAAVLEAKLGMDLEYELSGQGETMKVVVSAAIEGRPVLDSKGKPKTVDGTVADWKTTGNGSPWAARGGFPRMLRYRGAREWSRVHAPSLMLGVYSDDELGALSDETRANRARDVTHSDPVTDDGPPPPSAVVAIEHKPAATDITQAAPASDLVPGETMDPKTGEMTWGEPPADDGIPGFLDRRDAPSIQPADVEWLRELAGALSGCEDMVTFGETQRDVMAPQKGKVGPDAWKQAQQLCNDTFARLQKDS